jgi:hypothetical protein
LPWINFNHPARGLLNLFLLIGTALLSLNLPAADIPELDSTEVDWIGEQIFSNECNRNPACLTAWNAGENFPSLGIGHFIWYRQGQVEIFDQSFPALMQFMQARGMTIPAWVITANYASPWADREAFLAEMNGPRLTELRTFLGATMAEQTAFIIARFDNALAAMLASMNESPRAATLENNFYAVAATAPPYGLYALIDYVNFKGTGVSLLESYNGQGWGLKQVLLAMDNESADPLDAFITSASRMLALRAANAPAERNESRWLAGWNNRLHTYIPAQ